eukprot:COSAG04_NODE_812_length_10107_cov_2.942946_7_plen_62_part_00
MSGCAEWEAGGIGVTKWAIRSNHGGGYQFRLCKIVILSRFAALFVSLTPKASLFQAHAAPS